MNAGRRFLVISVGLGLGVACGGSSGSGASPGDDGGGLADSSGGGSSGGGAGNDAAGGGGGRDGAAGGGGEAGMATGTGTSQDAGGNSGNGQDCTSCAIPTPFCCVMFGGGGVQSVTCVAAQSACPAGTGGFACLGPADCAGGLVCCESGTGTGSSTTCTSTCPPTSQVCQVPADCPSTVPSCPMNGSRGDIGYGVCSPVREAGAPREAGSGQGDAGVVDGGGGTQDAAAVDTGTGDGGATGDGGTDGGTAVQDASAG